MPRRLPRHDGSAAPPAWYRAPAAHDRAPGRGSGAAGGSLPPAGGTRTRPPRKAVVALLFALALALAIPLARAGLPGPLVPLVPLVLRGSARPPGPSRRRATGAASWHPASARVRG